jgi:hypothetical protein
MSRRWRRPRIRGSHRLDCEEGSGWREDEQTGEENEVETGRAAGGEELAVLAEQVEEGLGDRERPEHEEVQPREPQPRRREGQVDPGHELTQYGSIS